MDGPHKDGPVGAPDAAEDRIEEAVDRYPVPTIGVAGAADVSGTRHIRSPGQIELEAEDSFLAPGTVIGRYMILEQLAAGGMGVVYKAYDPDLDRQIALKLVAVEDAHDEDSELRSRLLREAQGLAQLSHPNVVAVHDVGLFEGSVFLAMELVTGPTVRKWLKTQPSYRDKLDAFVAAGEGLAAAHRADLIHRDFKPDNVLIGDDGRPRVVDFGLVRAIDADPPLASSAEHERYEPGSDSLDPLDSARKSAASASSSQPRSGARLSTPLTMAGDIVGTPRYMSPEQYLGLAVDARCDQFSFCVALYEALYGRAPFRGTSPRALRRAICSGQISPPPASVRLPTHVRRALHKGLAVEVEARHPSMAVLLDQLRRDPWKRWRRAAIVAPFLALAAVVIFVSARSRAAAAERCQGAESRLVGVWDERAGESVHAAFVASGRAYAEATYQRVATVLDDHADRWRTMHRDACEATWVRGEQSQSLLDLRMRCLDRNLQAMDALVGLFASEADAKMVDRAIDAVHGLPAIVNCADVDALATIEPLPSDPTTRQRIEEIQLDLAHVSALARAGKPRDAIARAERAAAAAEQVGYRPLTARALLEVAVLKGEAGDAVDVESVLTRAIAAASASRDDLTAARAAARLIGYVGAGQGNYELAMRLRPLVEAIILRAGEPPLVHADMLSGIGVVHLHQGRYDEALAAFERALEIRRQAYGDDHPKVAMALNNIANTRERLADYDGAGRDHVQALAIKRRLLGEAHPGVGFGLNNYGIVLLRQGRLAQAQSTFERSRAILQTAFGAESPLIATPLTNIGLVLSELGKLDEALRVFNEVLVLKRKHYAADHLAVAEARYHLGAALFDQGSYEAARSHLEHVLAAFEKANARPTLIVDATVKLGLITAATIGCVRALPELEAALERARASLPEQSQHTASTLLAVGHCQIDLGRHGRAVPLLQESLDIHHAAASAGLEIPEVQLALARALWAARPHEVSRDRAIELVLAARGAVTTSEAPRAELLREIDQWLRAHPVDETR